MFQNFNLNIYEKFGIKNALKKFDAHVQSFPWILTYHNFVAPWHCKELTFNRTTMFHRYWVDIIVRIRYAKNPRINHALTRFLDQQRTYLYYIYWTHNCFYCFKQSCDEMSIGCSLTPRTHNGTFWITFYEDREKIWKFFFSNSQYNRLIILSLLTRSISLKEEKNQLF